MGARIFHTTLQNRCKRSIFVILFCNLFEGILVSYIVNKDGTISITIVNWS